MPLAEEEAVPDYDLPPIEVLREGGALSEVVAAAGGEDRAPLVTKARGDEESGGSGEYGAL